MKCPFSRSWYIVIINHVQKQSFNDGFVINIPKIIIPDSSSSTIGIGIGI